MPKIAKPHPRTVSQNIWELVRRETPEGKDPSVNAWAKKYDLDQSVMQRYVTGLRDPGTAALQNIADALTKNGNPIEAWQLLAPNLGEHLHEVMTNETGETRVVPIRIAVEKLSSGFRRVEGVKWTAKKHPGRRASDHR